MENKGIKCLAGLRPQSVVLIINLHLYESEITPPTSAEWHCSKTSTSKTGIILRADSDFCLLL